jgi:hypothetical protein
MSIQAVLLPLFVEVVLTFVLLFWMARLNVAAVRSGAVRPQDVALREPNWPARNRQIQNAYHKLPTLFYVLTILSIVLRHADLIFVLLAWVFVALRCLQAYVHVTDNDVARRGPLFLAGAVVLAVMWAIFALRILLGI